MSDGDTRHVFGHFSRRHYQKARCLTSLLHPTDHVGVEFCWYGIRHEVRGAPSNKGARCGTGIAEALGVAHLLQYDNGRCNRPAGERGMFFWRDLCALATWGARKLVDLAKSR